MDGKLSTQRTFEIWQSNVLQTGQNLSTISINIAKNMISKMRFAGEKHASTDLEIYSVSISDITTPKDNSNDPKQTEMLLEVISKISDIADGTSMM
jgi:hypothetical protein